MPELKVPDQLEPDCGNCQGMCCMAMEHRARDGFPIEQDKPSNTACVNLCSDPSSPDALHKCAIYDELLERGWKTCKTFSCHGAGQTASMFFKELGIDWALPSPDIDPAQRAILLENLNHAFYILDSVFGHLEFTKYDFPYSNKERFQAAKAATNKVLAEFNEFLKTNQKIDYNYWVYEKFMPAIKAAIAKATRDYFKGKVLGVLSIFKRASPSTNA
jgi:hypothetical protein